MVHTLTAVVANRAIVRWWLVGLTFTAGNLPVLYVLREFFGLPLAAATLISGELGGLARFLVNDRWVFGHRAPTLRRLWQYHVVVASSFAIWWVLTNALAFFGMSYVIASVVSTACTVCWSMTTNFLWVWRPRTAQRIDWRLFARTVSREPLSRSNHSGELTRSTD